MTKAVYGKSNSEIPISKDAWKRVSPYIVEKDLTIGEFFDLDKWPEPSRGKFGPGDKVTLRGIREPNEFNKYRAWSGVIGVVVGYRSSQSSSPSSEYKIYNPKTGRTRWIQPGYLAEVE